MTKQNLKIHVKSEEESRQAQECLFKLGYKWSVHSAAFMHLNKPHLFASDGKITFMYAEDGGIFKNHENKQVTLQELKGIAYGNVISGEEAKKAWANGQNVLVKPSRNLNWEDLTSNYLLSVFDDTNYEFKLKPQTIKIGNIDVPKPESEPLKDGENYYSPSIRAGDNHVGVDKWNGAVLDRRLLKRGLIHRTKEAAIAHAKALILVSGGSVEG